MNDIYIEVRQEETARARFKQNINLLVEVYRMKEAKTEDILLALHRKVKRKECLKKEYELICKNLNHVRFQEKQQTQAERCFIDRFKKEWRIQLYSQTWIGNLCLDFFTPAFGTLANRSQTKAKGVAFEIDGGVHNLEMKMKKDAFKMKSLSILNIVLWRFTNEQVYKGAQLPTRIEFSKYFRTLCSRERKRIWSRIYLLTVLYHGTIEVLSFYFPKLKPQTGVRT